MLDNSDYSFIQRTASTNYSEKEDNSLTSERELLFKVLPLQKK
jgi:hypothetical protein